MKNYPEKIEKYKRLLIQACFEHDYEVEIVITTISHLDENQILPYEKQLEVFLFIMANKGEVRKEGKIDELTKAFKNGRVNGWDLNLARKLGYGA